MTTATEATGGKVIVQFYRKTVCGSLYNEGEKAAFDEKTADLLINGGKIDAGTDFEQNVRPSAKLVRRLTAAQVAEEEAKGQPNSTITVDVTRASASQRKQIEKILAGQASAD